MKRQHYVYSHFDATLVASGIGLVLGCWLSIAWVF